MKRLTLIAAVVAFCFACENKSGADAAKTDEPAAPAEEVVKTEIPADLKAEAQKEVTAENVDAVAAELEKEIEADSP